MIEFKIHLWDYEIAIFLHKFRARDRTSLTVFLSNYTTNITEAGALFLLGQDWRIPILALNISKNKYVRFLLNFYSNHGIRFVIVKRYDWLKCNQYVVIRANEKNDFLATVIVYSREIVIQLNLS